MVLGPPFLKTTKARGIKGAALATSGAHEELKRAMAEVFRGAAWQRCVARLMRDCAGEASPQQPRRRAARMAAPVFRTKGVDQVRAIHHLAAEMPERCCPKAAAAFEEAEPDALVYLDFPASRWKGLRTNDVQERTDREIRRRPHVVQASPSTGALERLVGAVVCEQDGT